MDRYDEKAAQLWCLPQHAKKVFDSDMATSIGAATRAAASEAYLDSLLMAEPYHGSGCRDMECVCPFGDLQAELKAKSKSVLGGENK